MRIAFEIDQHRKGAARSVVDGQSVVLIVPGDDDLVPGPEVGQRLTCHDRVRGIVYELDGLRGCVESSGDIERLTRERRHGEIRCKQQPRLEGLEPEWLAVPTAASALPLPGTLP